MDFADVQRSIVKTARQYCQEYAITPTDDFAVLKLHEESGEFTQAYLIHKKLSRPEKFLDDKASREQMGRELADIVGMAIFAADVLDIDLMRALQKKWLRK